MEVGLPRVLADLFLDLHTNMQRHFRIGRHVGAPIPFNRGGGQGDSLWLLDALIITTVQFRMIEDTHPDVKTSSVVDDRTSVAPVRVSFRRCTPHWSLTSERAYATTLTNARDVHQLRMAVKSYERSNLTANHYLSCWATSWWAL